ncbi:exonuclease V [Mycena sanguinolenta]|nr:exonuclease V [Mycena sanguinolenta]
MAKHSSGTGLKILMARGWGGTGTSRAIARVGYEDTIPVLGANSSRACGLVLSSGFRVSLHTRWRRLESLAQLRRARQQLPSSFESDSVSLHRDAQGVQRTHERARRRGMSSAEYCWIRVSDAIPLGAGLTHARQCERRNASVLTEGTIDSADASTTHRRRHKIKYGHVTGTPLSASHALTSPYSLPQRNSLATSDEAGCKTCPDIASSKEAYRMIVDAAVSVQSSSISNESNDHRNALQSAEKGSPLHKYRRAGTLYVTDLSQLAWCELKYQYNLQWELALRQSKEPLASFRAENGKQITVQQDIAAWSHKNRGRGQEIEPTPSRPIQEFKHEQDVTVSSAATTGNARHLFFIAQLLNSTPAQLDAHVIWGSGRYGEGGAECNEETADKDFGPAKAQLQAAQIEVEIVETTNEEGIVVEKGGAEWNEQTIDQDTGPEIQAHTAQIEVEIETTNEEGTAVQQDGAPRNKNTENSHDVNFVFIHKAQREKLDLEFTIPEEQWALKVLELLSCLKSLRATGHAACSVESSSKSCIILMNVQSEVPVFGIVDGVVVSGRIDELILVANESESQLETGTKRAQSNQMLPSPKRARPLASAFKPERMSAPSAPSQCIRLVDTKTHVKRLLPSDKDAEAARRQLEVYHRLLTCLLDTSAPFSFSVLRTRLRLNRYHPFSLEFFKLATQTLKYDIDDLPTSLDAVAAHLRSTLADLDLPRLDNTLQINYISQKEYRENWDPHSRLLPSTVGDGERPLQIESKSFSVDDMAHDAFVRDALDWWKGKRPARGVSEDQRHRCNSCEFKDD